MLTIGVDVGGTGIKSALIDVVDPQNQDTYRILDNFWVATEGNRGRDIILANICKAVNHFDLSQCELVAVSSAGTIDWDSGRVIYATNALRGFTGLELTKTLSKTLDTKVVAINDAVAALIGEVFLTDMPYNDKIMMFTLGTGLGSSILTSRKLDKHSIRDTQSGHMPLHPNGRKCFCGNKGCAECYVSATGLKANAGTDNLNEVFSNKDKYAKALDAFYSDFVMTLANTISNYKPNAIIVGGGVIEARELWWNDFLDRYNVLLDTPISTAKLGNKAGALGAVYAALNGIFKEQ